MFCLRQTNKLINKVHERALRLIYQNNWNFEILLEKQQEFSIHQWNLQVLMTEIYEIVNDAASSIMKSLFQFHLNQCNLRNLQELFTEKRNTVNYGLETLKNRASAIWAELISKYVFATLLDEFKSKIKFWKYENFPCWLCKKYQPNLEYIN